MPTYIIDGVQCVGEQAVRDYCFNYVDPTVKHRTAPNGFKQDFRLASIAYTAPIAKLIEVLERTGHTVERVSE